MITFGFCVRAFFSSMLIVAITSFIAEVLSCEDDSILNTINYRLATILFWISVVCTVMSVFGMIWTL